MFKKIRKFLRLLFIRYHGLIGVWCGIFILVLSMTGILLNHTVLFHLNTIHFNNHALMQLYGFEKPKNIMHFGVDNTVITSFNGMIFLDGVPLNDNSGHSLKTDTIISVAHNKELMTILTKQSVILLTQDGTYIETLSLQELLRTEETITNILSQNEQFYLQSRTKNYGCDFNALTCKKTDTIIKNTPIQTPKISKDIDTKLNNYLYGEGISLYQIILDIHNGKILRLFGVILNDIIGVGLIILAIGGFIKWQMKKR
jgi:hypothetical protein